MMPKDGIARLRDHDAIFFGAAGFPGVPDHISLWGLLIPIRCEFDQCVNLRPVRLLPGVEAPVRAEPGEIDFWVLKENSEGEYSQVGGRLFAGTENEMVIQEAVFTRRGTDRILRHALSSQGSWSVDMSPRRRSQMAYITRCRSGMNELRQSARIIQMYKRISTTSTFSQHVSSCRHVVRRVVAVGWCGFARCAKPPSRNAVDMMLPGELRSEAIEAMRGISSPGEEDERSAAAAQSKTSS